ncbi:ribose-5-phosphate isomerase RpiA [Sphingomonas sp.]|uniref:ribose-5-phosphate isomerase RpiA n=1 Tax=Sphingomonas sp. TaxID=28214 RepID=UPI002FD9B7B0
MELADPERWKRAAAQAAVAEVEDGMILGLGTGSTAAHAIRLVGDRIAQGLRITAVATSRATAAAARAAGIPLVAPDGLAAIDLCIDGVDEIDPGLRAIKGGGGAMLLEMIVATLARRNIAIADSAKRVDQLGARAVPIEVLQAAQALVTAAVGQIGGAATLRTNSAGVILTDSGHPILDTTFPVIPEPFRLAQAMSEIPGVLGHGLFLTEIDALYCAGPDGLTCQERPADA